MTTAVDVRILQCEIAVRTANPLNGSQGFSRGAAMAAAGRRRAVRRTSRLCVIAEARRARVELGAVLPCTITLRRMAPSSGLDSDGLAASLKSVRDAVTDALGLRDDRDPRLTWRYEQGRSAPRQYAVVVTIDWGDVSIAEES